jgi:hypothetical protein
MNKKKYTIDIKYTDGVEETIQLETSNLKWTMDQYIRNRKPLNWEVGYINHGKEKGKL